MAMDTRKPKTLYPVRDEQQGNLEVRISLTTVCIKTGVVRVPRRHHELLFNTTNISAETDGFSAIISYDQAGQLRGLREMFLNEDVNPNDLLVLCFKEDGVSVGLTKRERVTREVDATQQVSQSVHENVDSQQQSSVVKRRVRIDVQQYYPLEKPLTSSLAKAGQSEATRNPQMVTARKVASVPERNFVPPSETGSQVGEVVVTRSAHTGATDRGEPYTVSADFEEWLTQDYSSEQLHASGVLKKEPSSSHPVGIGEAISQVERFLSLPDTPAIIQTAKVAEALGLSNAVCERALERISEDHDRVNRIRNGAYMIRQKRSTANVE